MKKISSLALLFLLCFFFSFYVNADYNETVQSDQIFPDTTDGVYYGLNSNYSLVMNQATSANPTPNGVKVTTWSRTGHSSQLWDTYTTTFSGYTSADIIVTNSDPHLALNINRSTYLATVYTLVGNYYRDCCVFSNQPRNSPSRSYYVYPRKASETHTRGLVGSTVNGQQFRWVESNSGTPLYRNVWYEVNSSFYRFSTPYKPF